MFISAEPLLPSDERSLVRCSPDAMELKEAKERSELVWNSWMKHSSRQSVKRGAPCSFTEAHKKVNAAQTRYYNCLEGLGSLKMPDTSSDDSDHSPQVIPVCPVARVVDPTLPLNVPGMAWLVLLTIP